MIKQNNSNSNGFIIAEYQDLLTPTSEKGKYICPNCNEPQLSINKDGKKFTCFNCQETKKIAYKLRELNGEFKKLPDKDLLQDYKPSKTRATKNTQDENEDNTDIKKIATIPEAITFLERNYKDRISYNVRSNDIEFDTFPIEIDSIRATLGKRHNIHFSSKDLLTECLLYLAKRNQYDPVKRYLERCRNHKPLVFDGLANKIFNCGDSELYQAYFETWLISCIARVYEPGCKSDEVLVLQGSQGYGKSEFFKTLSNDFFSDSMSGELGQNDLMCLNEFWIHEWGELDGFTAKVYHGKIKHFLSKQRDDFRLPYGRSLQKIPRRSVIVGTTNRDDFLNDPTGNRRFKIIPVSQNINITWIEEIKNSLWSMAIQKYENGQSWKLPKHLWEAQKIDNQNYEQRDPWEEILLPYLKTQEGLDVITKELLFKVEESGYKIAGNRADQMRLADILKRQGWISKLKKRSGQVIRVWINPDSKVTT